LYFKNLRVHICIYVNRFFTVGVHNISLTVILQASLGVPIKEV